MAIDLDGAYNRIQFNQLMELLMQSEDNLTLTRWIAGALLERTVGMQLGTGALLFIRTQWAYQTYPLSPVLFSVYPKGLADLNRNGLIYKTSRHSQEAAGAVQEVDGSVSQ